MQNFYPKFLNENRGVSLYLTLTLMALMLTIALGVSSILISQMRSLGEMGNSVVAFYAADTGIERMLYAARQESYAPSSGDSCGSPFSCPALSNGSSFVIEIQTGPETIIKSKGTYKDVSRSIEINY